MRKIKCEQGYILCYHVLLVVGLWLCSFEITDELAFLVSNKYLLNSDWFIRKRDSRDSVIC